MKICAGEELVKCGKRYSNFCSFIPDFDFGCDFDCGRRTEKLSKEEEMFGGEGKHGAALPVRADHRWLTSGMETLRNEMCPQCCSGLG
jgi:hypothetical protein